MKPPEGLPLGPTGYETPLKFLCFTLAVLSGLWVPLGTLLTAFFGHPSSTTWASVVCSCSSINAYRQASSNPARATHLLLFGVLSATGVNTCMTGGLQSPFAPCFLLVPVTAAANTVPGHHHSNIWTVLTILYVALEGALGHYGLLGEVAVLPQLANAILYGCFLLLLHSFSVNYHTVLVSALSTSIESERKAKDDSEEKNNFLFKMSHEMRTPLMGIVGWTDLLLNDGRLTDPQRSGLQGILSSIKQLQHVTDQVMEYSSLNNKVLEPKEEEFDFKNVTLDVISAHIPLVDCHAVQLSVVVPREGNVIKCDRYMYQQCLRNLVDNAIKFTESGMIQVRAAVNSEGKLLVSVKDSGIGMTQDHAVLVMRPFLQADNSIQRRYGGTGLGLAITKEMIYKLGGDLEIRTLPGIGTTVQFWIPDARLHRSNMDGAEAIAPNLDVDLHFVKRSTNDDSLDGMDVYTVQTNAENGESVLHPNSSDTSGPRLPSFDNRNFIQNGQALPELDRNVDPFATTPLRNGASPKLGGVPNLDTRSKDPQNAPEPVPVPIPAIEEKATAQEILIELEGLRRSQRNRHKSASKLPLSRDIGGVPGLKGDQRGADADDDVASSHADPPQPRRKAASRVPKTPEPPNRNYTKTRKGKKGLRSRKREAMNDDDDDDAQVVNADVTPMPNNASAVVNKDVPKDNAGANARNHNLDTAERPNKRVAQSRKRTIDDEPQSKVIVCEDDPVCAKVIQAYLHRMGKSVVVGRNGLEGIELYKEMLVADTVELVIMDLNMPLCDGRTAAMSIHALARAANKNSPPIIVLSADTSAATKFSDSERELLTAVCTKPIRFHTFCEIVSRFT